jgi:hypothetical protein
MLRTIKQMTSIRGEDVSKGTTIPTLRSGIILKGLPVVDSPTLSLNNIDSYTSLQSTQSRSRSVPSDIIDSSEFTSAIEPPPPPTTTTTKKYVYRLEEDHMLDDTLDMTTEADDKRKETQEIQLCVYHVRDDLPIPFLQFMMAPPPPPVDVATVGAALAPATVGWLSIHEPIPHGDGDGDGEYPTRAINACIEHVLSTYPGISMGNIEFRGWFTMQNQTASGESGSASGESGTTIAVFCIIDAEQMDTTSDVWANLDELVYQSSWRGVPVDPAVTRLFQQHPFFGEIVHSDHDLPAPLPMSLYLCKRTVRDATEATESGDNNSWGGTYTNYERGSLPRIDLTSVHPLFGDHWYFSPVRLKVGLPEEVETLTGFVGKPISKEPAEQIPTLRSGIIPKDLPVFLRSGSPTLGLPQRYSVFVDDPLTHVLFRDISTELTDADRTYLTQKYIGDPTLPSPASDGDWPVISTFFYENGVPMWCIRDRLAFARM